MKNELLKGKVVVVVGAGGLLGRRLAAAAAGAGARVALADIAPAQRQAAALERRHGRGSAFAVGMDITSRDSVRAAIAAVAKKFGRVDAVVNSAYPRNKNYGRKLEKVEYADFCENLGLHLGGYFLVAQQFAEYFKKNGGGQVLNMSSVYGVVAPRFEVYAGTPMTMPVEYAAIKAGLLHLTRYMAKYYAGTGVRFNAVSLGGIEDGQPAPFLRAYRRFCSEKGMLDASDVTGTVLYLLSGLARYVNGQNVIVDDGFTL